LSRLKCGWDCERCGFFALFFLCPTQWRYSPLLHMMHAWKLCFSFLFPTIFSLSWVLTYKSVEYQASNFPFPFHRDALDIYPWKSHRNSHYLLRRNICTEIVALMYGAVLLDQEKAYILALLWLLPLCIFVLAICCRHKQSLTLDFIESGRMGRFGKCFLDR